MPRAASALPRCIRKTNATALTELRDDTLDPPSPVPALGGVDALARDFRATGTEVTGLVAALPDGPAVVVLTTFDLDEYVHAALRRGAAGFLVKDIAPNDLMAAIHVVAGGDAMISPRITKRLLGEFADGGAKPGARKRLEALTPRELEVAVAVGHGSPNAAIAKSLHLSESTVKVHIGRVLTKLDVANRTQVAIVVHDAGLA